MKRLLAAFGLLGVLCAASACVSSRSADEPAELPSIVWRCAEGKTFSSHYSAETDVTIIHAAGQRYALPRAMSASGARYATETVEFWEHQGSARLNGAEGGPYAECTQN